MGKGFLYLIIWLHSLNCWASSRIEKSSRCEREIVVLVPGFFNLPGIEAKDKIDPERMDYFSTNVVKTIESKGYKVIVFKNLDPIGNIDTNGAKTLSNFEILRERYPNCKLSVVAHSAGGLYTAYAVTRNKSLNIKQVVTIATPYEGADIVDLISWIPGWQGITKWLNLTSLNDFDKSNALELLKTFTIPQQIKWTTVAVAQSGCFLLSCTKAQKLSWLLTAVWSFAGKVGDGIVSYDSSILKNENLRTDSNENKKINVWPEIVPLEHWEVVLNPDLFKVLGVTNTSWVAEKQVEFFNQLLATF